MKHLYAFFTLFLLTTTLSFAQRDFRPGYIVQNGDTLRGLINYQGDKRQAMFASFKSDAKASAQNYSPSQITAYGLTDGYAYEAKKISSPDSTYLLFLRVLVKGPASLLFYKDQNSGDHFYLEKADSVKELVYKKVLEAQKEGHMAFVTYKRYKNTLYDAFTDCPSVASAISKLEFKEAALINIIADYNACVAPSTKNLYEVKARKSEITWGVHAGAHKSRFLANSNTLPNYEVVSKPGYIAGLSLNISLPWAHQNTSAFFEAQYSNSAYHKYEYSETNGTQNSYTLDASFHHLKFPASIRHVFNVGSINPFINAGAVLNYALEQKQTITTTTKYSYTTPSTVPEGDFIKYTRKFSRGYLVGGGLMYETSNNKKYSLEVRYEKNNGYSNTPSYETIIRQVSVLTGIYF